MAQQIVVKKNAPNWPAMTSSKPVSNTRSEHVQDFRLSCAAASLWLDNRYNHNNNPSARIFNKSLPSFAQQNKQRNNAFAPKIVRQCPNCQMLYSNFHSCKRTTLSHSSSSDVAIQVEKVKDPAPVIRP